MCVGVLMCGAASAQQWPVKPVRIINPFSPGGSLDLVSRLLAKGMSTDLGQQFVVENRPGAGGSIGIELVAKSPPDGYTLLMVQSSLTVNPSLQRKVPYDPVKDFEPVSKVSSYMFFAVVHPSLPVRTVKELITLAKAKPGQVNYASVGVGSGTNLAGELFGYMAGVQLTHIPYKGTGQVMPDLLGGQIALSFGSTSVVPHVKQGKLHILGVTGARRAAVLPNAPTLDESGLKGYEVATWYAMWGVAGSPQVINDRMVKEIASALASNELKGLWAQQGAVIGAANPKDMAAFVSAEIAKWAKVAKSANIQVD